MTNTIHALLLSHPFCHDLSQRVLDSMAQCASISHYESGEFIFRQHQEAGFFFLILEGKVDVELFSTVGGPVVLQSLKSGDALGWSWLVAPFRWSADARAMEQTKVISLDAKKLRALMHKDYEIGFHLMERLVPVLARRLESANLRLLNIYGAHS